jgi:hypothetical protein
MIATRFQKRPLVIEAVQWPGGAETASPIIDWILANGGIATWNEEYPAWESDDGTLGHGAAPEQILVLTLEGPVSASIGDWIIRGIQGEFYPCKPDIFLATYELVTTDSTASTAEVSP